jgi:N-methylhydantoinase A
VIDRHVAKPLGLTTVEAAIAISVVANQQMARVLRAVSTERGRGLGDQTLIVSGGSGGLHAAALADTVGIRTVLVPPMAGVLSAVGLLWSPVALTEVHSANGVLQGDATITGALQEELAGMEEKLRLRLAQSGLEAVDTVVTRVLDLRYSGQATELSLQLTDGPFDPAMAENLTARFRSEHQATYGHGGEHSVEIARVRVTVAVPSPAMPLASRGPDADGEHEDRDVCFGGQVATVPVMGRAALDKARSGPLVIDDVDTSIVVPPSWSARLDPLNNLILERTP